MMAYCFRHYETVAANDYGVVSKMPTLVSAEDLYRTLVEDKTILEADKAIVCF